MSNYIKEKNRFRASSKKEIMDFATNDAWWNDFSLIIMDFGKYTVGLEPDCVEDTWKIVVTDGLYKTTCHIFYDKYIDQYVLIQDNNYCMNETIKKRLLSPKYIDIGQSLKFAIKTVKGYKLC